MTIPKAIIPIPIPIVLNPMARMPVANLFKYWDMITVAIIAAKAATREEVSIKVLAIP